MPRTKSIQHYPDRYQEIIRECGLEGKQIEVPVTDARQAASLRGHWYAFIGALKAEAGRVQRDAAARGRVLTAGEQDIIHLAGLSASVMVNILAGPPVTVVFQSREHSWQAKALRGATVIETTGSPSASGLDTTAARLLAIQAEAQGRMIVCPVCGDVIEPDQILTHEPCRSTADASGGV